MLSKNLKQKSTEIQPVTFVPTSKPDGTSYTGDPFTVRKEIHGVIYIGDDGYVVPRNFGEFETQEPHYIRRWVQKKIHRNMVDDDVLDWTADLNMHLRYLPEDSTGRKFFVRSTVLVRYKETKKVKLDEETYRYDIVMSEPCFERLKKNGTFDKEEADQNKDGSGKDLDNLEFDTLELANAKAAEFESAKGESYNEAHVGSCTDLIQCFNPYSCFGASKRRFLSYVNRCLANRFSTILNKNLKNPIMRDGNLVYDPTATAEEMAEHPGLGGEEYIHQNSGLQRERIHRAEENGEHKLFLSAFKDFLKEHEPSLIPMMGAISVAETQEEAQAILGITPQVFHHNKKRLKILGECFRNGEGIPQWRKYKRHVKVGTFDMADNALAAE